MGSPSGDQLRGVVVQQVFVDSEVLFFGEDGVVRFQAVFLEEGFVSLGLDI